jgi:hydroxymethylpyrimidine/phosphomethylpyrimidine kinase
MPKQYFRCVSIAGSDSGGGAGIQADLKTFAALGCFGMTVITALTAQNTKGVTGIHPVPSEFVVAQMDAVLTDIGADAVKIGMLFSADLIQTVATQLEKHKVKKIVLDPVMVAQSGDKLLQDDAIAALKKYLLPLATVVTPNLPEAAVLVGKTLESLDDIKAAARTLAVSAGQGVLIKGGHHEGAESDDLLFLSGSNRFATFSGARVATLNNHGTGCTLSSAIAAYLAKGLAIEAACAKAKQYIQEAISAGANYRIGQGHGPVHHFHRFW